MNELNLNNLVNVKIRQCSHTGGFVINCINDENQEFEIYLDPVKDENLKLTFGED